MFFSLSLALSLSLPPMQYHINKLSIMSSDHHMNNSEKEVDEVDAALSDLEITLEGGKTSNTLVRPAPLPPPSFISASSSLIMHVFLFFFNVFLTVGLLFHSQALCSFWTVWF